MPITIANTLTTNTMTASNTSGSILIDPQQIEFFNNSPGSNFNIGCAGGNFYVYNAGASLNVLEIDYINSNVNINNSLTVNTATVTTTLTASNIVPTAANTGTIGTNSLILGMHTLVLLIL